MMPGQFLRRRPLPSASSVSARCMAVKSINTTTISSLRNHQVPGIRVPGKVVALSNDQQDGSFLFRDWVGNLCTVELQDTSLLKHVNENASIALHEPLYDIDSTTSGNHRILMSSTSSISSWSDPVTVAGWNDLASTSTATIHCARSAWDLVPRIRRRMAVVLTNLSFAVAASDDGGSVAAAWYAGAATVLDPTVTAAWERLLHVLVDELDLPTTAYHVMENQVPRNIVDEGRLDRFQDRIRKHVASWLLRSEEEENVPLCWSLLFPTEMDHLLQMPPRITADIIDADMIPPTEQEDFSELRNIAKTHFQNKDYDLAKEAIVTEWMGLQGMASDLSVTALHLGPTAKDTRFNVTSLLLDGHNAQAWIRWANMFHARDQSIVGVAILDNVMDLVPKPEVVLPCRQTLQTFQERTARPPQRRPLPKFSKDPP